MPLKVQRNDMHFLRKKKGVPSNLIVFTTADQNIRRVAVPKMFVMRFN